MGGGLGGWWAGDRRVDGRVDGQVGGWVGGRAGGCVGPWVGVRMSLCVRCVVCGCVLWSMIINNDSPGSHLVGDSFHVPP